MSATANNSAYERDAVALFGVPMDRISLKQASAHIRNAAAVRKHQWISTVNLDWMLMADRDPDFRASILRSDLVTCDGAPLLKLSGLMGDALPERVTGADLFEQLRDEDAAPLKLFFFGGRDESAARAHARFEARERGIRTVGAINPGFGDLDALSDPAHIAEINASGADFLIVALGAAKGQAWIARNRARLTVPLISHLGAVVDFAAGEIARAPKVAQKLHMEWAWRIGQDRALWRRYANDAALLPRLTRQAFQCRRALKSMKAPAAQRPSANLDGRTLRLSGFMPRADLAPLRAALRAAEQGDGPLTIDFGDTGAVDLAGIALLLIAQQRFADQGRPLTILSRFLPTRVLLHVNHLPLSSAAPITVSTSKDREPASNAARLMR